MPNKKYTANGTIYTIPVEQDEEFRKDFPDAEEIRAYQEGATTYNIPASKEQDFLKDMPYANPLGRPANSVEKNPSWVYDTPKKKEDTGFTSKVQSSSSQEYLAKPSQPSEDGFRTVQKRKTEIDPLKPVMDRVKEKYYQSEPTPYDRLELFSDDVSKFVDSVKDKGLTNDQFQQELVKIGQRHLVSYDPLTGKVSNLPDVVKRYQDRVIQESDKGELSFGESVSKKLGVGGLSLGKIPIDLLAVTEMGVNQGLKAIGLPEGNVWNSLSDDIQQNKEYMSQEGAKYDGNITDYLQEGDFKKAVGATALGIAESLPSILLPMGMGINGGLKAGVALTSAGKGLDVYIRDSRIEDMPQSLKLIDAVTQGLSEYAYELIGSGAVVNSVNKAIGKEGVGAVRDYVKSEMTPILQRNLSKVMEGVTPAMVDGASEYMTEMSDMLVENLTKGTPIDPKRATDAFIVGAVSSGAITVPMNLNIGKKEYVKKVAESIPKEYSSETLADVLPLITEKTTLEEQKKSTNKTFHKPIDDKIEQLNQQVADVVEKNEGVQLIEKEEGKVQTKKDNASTAPLASQETKSQADIQYEDAMSKKSPDVVAQMPTYKGKKFSFATILPNGDISNVYVRGEGQSHRDYMTPEDADAYEEGRISFGVWDRQNNTFIEMPQGGSARVGKPLSAYGQKVMDIAAAKVTPPVQKNEMFTGREQPSQNEQTINRQQTEESADNVTKSSFDNVKTGDVVYLNGNAVEVVGKMVSRGGADVIEVRTQKRNTSQLEEMALNSLSIKYDMTFEDVKKFHGGEYLNVLSDLEKVEASTPGQTITVDKNTWDNDVTHNKPIVEPKIGEQTNAPKIESTTEVPLGNQPNIGEEVRGRDTGQQEITGEETQEASQATADKVKALLDAEAPPIAEGNIFGVPTNILRNKRAKNKPMRPIKQLLKEQFTPQQGMPKGVFDVWVSTKGKIKEDSYRMRNLLNDKIKELSDVYGTKFTDDDLDAISTALENLGTSQASRDIAMNTIAKKVPKQAVGAIAELRNVIDSYSDKLKMLDMIGSGLEAKMDANTGYYVTRTYKKHTDRNWTWDNIPQKIKEDAAAKLAEIYPEMTADEILGMEKAMIETKDLTDYILSQGNSLADIDKKSLKKRSVFLTDNPEIRALLGENRDPFYNFAVSVTRMSEMAERGKMLENIKDMGLQDGWLSENPSYEKNHIAKIVYNKGTFAGKPGVKQLGDYYTTPEYAQSISGFFDQGSPMGKFMRGYMMAITAVKLSKTAGSVKGIIRNFKSNTTNAIANANWNIPQTTKYLYNNLKNKESSREFIAELYRNNIIGDSSNAGELIRNVQDLSGKMSEIPKSDETINEQVKRKIIDNVIKLYGFADDVWKVYRYGSEYTRYNDAYIQKGLNPVEADKAAQEQAMKILHKTSTYYSQLPPFIQNMRKLPFVNTFVSFPYLTMSNYIGTWQTAMQEMKDPSFRAIGLQRIMGSLAAVSALGLFAAFKNREEGVDEKQLESWRRFLPDFWRNDVITINDVGKNGVAQYNNVSYMDYYGVITTPLLMLQRKLIANGTLTDEDLVDAATEFAGKFIGWDILFNQITQLKNNQDATGRQIYNPQDEWRAKFDKISNYLWSAFEPGTMTDANRIWKTYREGGEWQRQLTGTLTGTQTRTIDPLKSWSWYMLPKYKDNLENARRIYTNQLRSYEKLANPEDRDKVILMDAKQRAEGSVNKILDEMVMDFDAAMYVGVDRKDLVDAIKSNKLRLDKDIRGALLFRNKLRLTDDGTLTHIESK